MIIHPYPQGGLSRGSLSDAVRDFTQISKSIPRHLIISRTDQVLAEKLVEGGDILVLFLGVLPPGVWMLCSPKAVLINGEQATFSTGKEEH